MGRILGTAFERYGFPSRSFAVFIFGSVRVAVMVERGDLYRVGGSPGSQLRAGQSELRGCRIYVRRYFKHIVDIDGVQHFPAGGKVRGGPAYFDTYVAYIDIRTEVVGEEKVSRVLGTGVKKLAPIEIQNYGRTNRSLHYTSSLEKGHKIESKDIAVLRTEKVLTPGIPPEFLDTVIGCVLQKDVTSGSGVAWEDLLQR